MVVGVSNAGDESEPVPARFGLGLMAGNTYLPDNDHTVVQGTLFGMWDYDQVWFHRAPDPMRFKVEADMGATVRPDVRVFASLNMVMLYYLEGLSNKRLRPYFEAGIGAIYHDFRVDGQAYRLNFNPILGLGTDIHTRSVGTWFSALRIHHISNASLHEDNRGINTLMLVLGRYF